MGTSNIFHVHRYLQIWSNSTTEFFYNWAAQPPLFGSVIWKEHPFANATFMLMLHLKFLEPLSWKFCVYFVSFSIKSFFCQSNSARNFLSTIKTLRYPLPFPKINKPPNKWTRTHPDDLIHGWHQQPSSSPSPSPSTWCNQPTNRGCAQNLHALGSNNYWSRSFSASDVPLGSWRWLWGERRGEGLDF